MAIEERSFSESERDEVLAMLYALGDDVYLFRKLSHSGLEALRDIIGTDEMQRVMDLGLSEADAYRYARVVARGACSLILTNRQNGGMDPLSIVITSMAFGYERGLRDAANKELSPEAIRLLSEKVEREEENGRKIEEFRRELEDLE